MSLLEICGVVLNLACVLLLIRRSIWNFPVGIASCAAYLVAMRFPSKPFTGADIRSRLMTALHAPEQAA